MGIQDAVQSARNDTIWSFQQPVKLVPLERTQKIAGKVKNRTLESEECGTLREARPNG